MSTFKEQMETLLQEKASLQQRAKKAEELVMGMLAAARGSWHVVEGTEVPEEIAEVVTLRKQVDRAASANERIDAAEHRADEAERLAGGRGEKVCEAAIRAFVHQWSCGQWHFERLPVPFYQAVIHIYGRDHGSRIARGMVHLEERRPEEAEARIEVIEAES